MGAVGMSWGPYVQDCHWMPQVAYVLSPCYQKQIVHRLLWIGNLSEELPSLLAEYASASGHQLMRNVDGDFASKSKRKAKECSRRIFSFSNRSLDMLDDLFADDF